MSLVHCKNVLLSDLHTIGPQETSNVVQV